MKFILFLFVIFSPHCCAQIYSSVNRKEAKQEKIVFITVHDKLELSVSKPVFWFFLKPELKEYDNLSGGAEHLTKIVYYPEPIASKETWIQEFKKLSPGTYYIGVDSVAKISRIETAEPIHLLCRNIIQVVVRENNDYIGFLTEQLGLPFIIPPRIIGGYGHQTDLRIGTDCAELAIYGKRRMGYKIPYCGPKGICQYLKPADKLKPGTIIHFGFQVSVLYKDRGKSGKLDGNDLIIHAFKNKVTIEEFRNTELFKKKYLLFNWIN